MLFEAILAIFFLIFGAYALWIAWFRPDAVPMLLAAALPCSNFLIDWHVQWSPGKVVLLTSALVLPFHLLKNPKLRSSLKLPPTLRRFLAVQLLLTLLAYILSQPGLADPGLATMRSATYRPIVQLVSEWVRVGALLTLVGWVRDRDRVLRIYKVCLAVTTCAALYGVYQFIGYYAGLPITGIARADAHLNGQLAITQIAGVELFRPGSFVGEPKNLAEWLIPSILFIVCTKIFRTLDIRSWLTSYPVLFLHCLALMLTSATSSYIGLCVGLLPVAWLCRGSAASMGRIAAVLITITIAALALGTLAGGELSREVVVQRTVGRFDEAEPSLLVDTAAVQFLRDHPTYLLSGVGLGNASFSLGDYVPDWIEQQFEDPVPLSISSMYLLLLMEGGVPVLLLFLLLLGQCLLRARRVALMARCKSDEALIFTSAAICCMAAVLGAFYTTEQDGMLWLYFGLLLAICRIAGRTRVQTTEPNRPPLGVPLLAS